MMRLTDRQINYTIYIIDNIYIQYVSMLYIIYTLYRFYIQQRRIKWYQILSMYENGEVLKMSSQKHILSYK